MAKIDMWSKFINYLKETRLEMKKVNWPTKRQATRFTLTVILVSLAVSALLGAFDFLFHSVLVLLI